MHPHLVGEQKEKHCAHLIQALHECHEQGLFRKFTGGCNTVKHDLNMCLRAERVERTNNHVKEAKEKRKKIQQVWKQIDDNS